MILLLAYAVTLVVAVLLSGVARKTVISLSVLFLVVGFLIGPGGTNLSSFRPQSQFLTTFVELALVSVLFTDGMHIGLHELRSTWQLPGRALLLGLPITLLIIAVIARMVTNVSWAEALLVGAVLSPTDPVFASAIVSRPEVPRHLRELLNVESGMNDGLALPIILTVLAFIHSQPIDLLHWVIQLGLGILIGISIAWVILWISSQKPFHVSQTFQPLLGFSIGLLVYSLASLLNGNSFLAAFSAGITVATVKPDCREAFQRLGENVAELLKLAALLTFGVLLTLDFLVRTDLREVLFAILVLLLARPIGLGLALIRSRLDFKERLTAVWFGPRGFASVVYGLLVLQSGVPRAGYLFHLVGIVIILSIIVHSSTDIIFARWFQKMPAQAANHSNQ